MRVDVNEKLKFDMGRVENIEGKEENAGFFLSPITAEDRLLLNLSKSCHQKIRKK